MTPSQRIRYLIKSKNLSVEAFAEQTGTTRGTLNQMFKNDSNPKLPLLEACVNLFPDLNPRWLLTGKGDIWESNPDNRYEDLQVKIKEMEDLMNNVVLKLEKQVDQTFIDIQERMEKLENQKKED